MPECFGLMMETAEECRPFVLPLENRVDFFFLIFFPNFFSLFGIMSPPPLNDRIQLGISGWCSSFQAPLVGRFFEFYFIRTNSFNFFNGWKSTRNIPKRMKKCFFTTMNRESLETPVRKAKRIDPVDQLTCGWLSRVYSACACSTCQIQWRLCAWVDGDSVPARVGSPLVHRPTDQQRYSGVVCFLARVESRSSELRFTHCCRAFAQRTKRTNSRLGQRASSAEIIVHHNIAGLFLQKTSDSTCHWKHSSTTNKTSHEYNLQRILQKKILNSKKKILNSKKNSEFKKKKFLDSKKNSEFKKKKFWIFSFFHFSFGLCQLLETRELRFRWKILNWNFEKKWKWTKWAKKSGKIGFYFTWAAQVLAGFFSMKWSTNQAKKSKITVVRGMWGNKEASVVLAANQTEGPGNTQWITPFVCLDGGETRPLGVQSARTVDPPHPCCAAFRSNGPSACSWPWSWTNVRYYLCAGLHDNWFGKCYGISKCRQWL